MVVHTCLCHQAVGSITGYQSSGSDALWLGR